MGCEVYADGNEIACKAGDGKVIAAFPDVCLSPPSPPAGPVPVPYPDTSFSKDMQNGSKSVKISNKEVMLKDKSFYKSSPLGDEAATRTFGGSVITHVITGKTYFVAWSMDVKFEGLNVDRHVDLTTSNHASQPGATPPNPNLEAMEWAQLEDVEDVCACCGKKPRHSKGAATTFDDFYGLNEKDGAGNLTVKAQSRLAFVEKVKNKKAHGCTCKGNVLPQPPCNVFRKPVTKAEKKAIEKAHSKNAPSFRAKIGLPRTSRDAAKLLGIGEDEAAAKVAKVNHLTPKNAGGCPTGEGNLQSHYDLCAVCQGFDDEFGKWQSEIPTL